MYVIEDLYYPLLAMYGILGLRVVYFSVGAVLFTDAIGLHLHV
jgi:hypothetical protein